MPKQTETPKRLKSQNKILGNLMMCIELRKEAQGYTKPERFRKLGLVMEHGNLGSGRHHE